MAWAAFDRGIKGVEEFGLEGPADHWRQLRDQVHEDVCRRGFDDELGSYVQSYGSKQLDASLLLLPSLGFPPVSDDRIRRPVEAIVRGLLVDGPVLRPHTRAVTGRVSKEGG